MTEILRVDALPRISRDGFRIILEAAGSPAAPAAGACYDAIAVLGMDPAVGLAFFQHESTFGTAGWATRTHNWGNLRPGSGWALKKGLADGITSGGEFLVFTRRVGEPEAFEWARSAGCWAELMLRYGDAGWLDGGVDEILQRYAPTGDGNVPTAYAAAVKAHVASWSLSYPPESDEPEDPVDDEMDWVRDRITDFAQRMDILEGADLARRVEALEAIVARQSPTVAPVEFGPASTTGAVPYEPVGEVPSQ